MKFFIAINEAQEGESQTFDVIDTGSDYARTNKRILKEYFLKVGVHQSRVKYVMKQMGFWGERLGK